MPDPGHPLDQAAVLERRDDRRQARIHRVAGGGKRHRLVCLQPLDELPLHRRQLLALAVIRRPEQLQVLDRPRGHAGWEHRRRRLIERAQRLLGDPGRQPPLDLGQSEGRLDRRPKIPHAVEVVSRPLSPLDDDTERQILAKRRPDELSDVDPSTELLGHAVG
ncbi:MAG: hypothetical protein R2849_08745 [Thermomicrobiales bacterium]